jgi:Flp pilus assembly protein TadG
MRPLRAWTDEQGTSSVEFAMAAPAYIAIVMGTIIGGIVLWTQFGLQYGVKAAARCATVDPVMCSSLAQIQDYAVKHSLGVNPPASAFMHASVECGNRVTASYSFQSMLTLTAQACFPKVN